jgi:hypothetical protein
MIIGVSVVTSNHDLIMHLQDVDTVEHAVHEFGIQITLLLNPEDRVVNVGVEPLNQEDLDFADAIQSALVDRFGLEYTA